MSRTWKGETIDDYGDGDGDGDAPIGERFYSLKSGRFHQGGRIAELIEQAGCRLLYLPPYSPDLNRIEKCWAWLKSRIRKQLPNSTGLRDAMDGALKSATS